MTVSDFKISKLPQHLEQEVATIQNDMSSGIYGFYIRADYFLKKILRDNNNGCTVQELALVSNES